MPCGVGCISVLLGGMGDLLANPGPHGYGLEKLMASPVPALAILMNGALEETLGS